VTPYATSTRERGRARARHPSARPSPRRTPQKAPQTAPQGTVEPPVHRVRGRAASAPAATPTVGLRRWRLRPSRLPTATSIAVLVGVLCVFGLVMVGSASPIISLQLYGSTWTILLRQTLWMALGTLALVLCARIDYRRWRALRAPLLVVAVGLLVAVLVPGVGVTAGGSSRWIGAGALRVQPSELMKLALAVFAADLLTRRSDRLHEPKRVLAPVLTVYVIAALLILKQPDMGTALVLGCIAFGILFMGGVPIKPIVGVLAASAAVAVIFGLADPYRRDRILSFLNPGAHRAGSGYQVWQSLVGLGSGHLFGLGLGGGRQKWGILPNAHTDFIFSVVGEELGLVGAVLLLGLFFALAWFGFRAATRAPDRFGSLLAVGVTIWITSQAVINVGAVIGVLPVTGIPLPFVSFGGSSLVVTLAATGILLNIAAQERTAPAAGQRLRRRPRAA
jgi:cell division protein FtsW